MADEVAESKKAPEGQKPPGRSEETEPATGSDEAAPPAGPHHGVAEAAAAPVLADALAPPPVGDAADAYHQRARLAEDRLSEVLGAYRKLKSENDGYRDRVTRNIERRYEQRRERLLLKFIDILDNMDRALDAAEKTYAGEPLIEGLILVRTQLLQTLQEEGLERIPVLGLPYDPNVSEAVETQIVSEAEHHHVVVKDLMRGYRLNGRVARASRVVIGEYPSAPAEPRPKPAMPAAETGVVAAAPALEVARREDSPEPEDLTPPRPPSASQPATVPPAAGEEGPTLEEIIARAEAQEALFPGAFDDDEEDEEG